MSREPSEKTARDSAGWVLGALISLAALAVALWGVEPGRVADALRGARYGYLIPAAVAIVLGLAARARSWRILLGDGVSLGRTFSALNVGYLLNNVLPFRLGEVGRAYLVSRGQETTASAALSSVVVERLIDVVVSLAGLLAALPFALSAAWAPRLAWGAAGLALVLFVGLYIAAHLRQTIVRLLDATLARLPGGHARQLSGLADSFLTGLDVLRDPRRLTAAGFWSTVAWLTAWVQVWLVQRAFGIDSWTAALFVLGVAAFGNAVPSSPGALGVYELAVVAGLLAFAVPRETAVSVALLSHALVLGVTSSFGAAALAREGQSLSELAASAQRVLGRAAVDVL